MAQVRFPDGIDTFGLTLARTVYNASSQARVYTLVEAFYAIIELQKAILAGVPGSQVVSAVAVADTTALQAQIDALQAQINAKGDHYELTAPPPASLGKNGDTAFDSTGGFGYKKEGNLWTQQP